MIACASHVNVVSLANYRPLWDIVMITFMLGGTAICVTSLILARRVLGRSLARGSTAAATSRADDLVAEAESQGRPTDTFVK